MVGREGIAGAVDVDRSGHAVVGRRGEKIRRGRDHGGGRLTRAVVGEKEGDFRCGGRERRDTVGRAGIRDRGLKRRRGGGRGRRCRGGKMHGEQRCTRRVRVEDCESIGRRTIKS